MKKKYKKRKKGSIPLTTNSLEVYQMITKRKLKKFPNNYLSEEIAKELVIHVFVNKLKFSRQDICGLNFNLLSDHKLGGIKNIFNHHVYHMIDYVFNDTSSEIFEDVLHGEKIYEWELKKVFPDFWKDPNNRTEFILWIAKKENLDITKLEDAKKIKAKLIRKYRGNRMLKVAPYGLHGIINEAVGNIYKEWQFIKINCWTDEKVLEAIKWLIEERLNWTEADVKNNLTAKTFYDNDLGGLLSKTCDNSPIIALEKAYPGRYKQSDLVRGERKKESLQKMRDCKKRK